MMEQNHISFIKKQKEVNNMTYRVIMNEDKKRHLNVWVDNITKQSCYCNNAELNVLFVLALKKHGYNCDEAVLKDFIKTYKELNDFCFDITTIDITYYDLGGNAKNMAIYNGDN